MILSAFHLIVVCSVSLQGLAVTALAEHSPTFDGSSVHVSPVASSSAHVELTLLRTSHPWPDEVKQEHSERMEERDFAPQTRLHRFARGARYFSATAGTSRDSSIGRIYLTQMSIDHYIFDDFALRTGINFGYADADRTSGGVQGGPELGLRWHFWSGDRLTTYIDGSVATVAHQHPLTERSLQFNFDLQAGLGATFQLTEDAHLKGGVRWHHLSNARVRGKSRNLGYDAPKVYLGVLWRF